MDQIMALPKKKEKSVARPADLVVAVASGKGGVGKSTVAAGLALAFRDAGLRVGLLDADVYGPSLVRLLRETSPPEKVGGSLRPGWAQGVRLLSMGRFETKNKMRTLRAPLVSGILSAFTGKVTWGPLDLFLIDFPPGTGDVHLSLCQQLSINGAVLVTTPQEVALMDVRRAAESFYQLGVPVAGVVENMSYLEVAGQRVTPFGQGGGERLSGEVGAPLLGAIPLDGELCKACDEGLRSAPSHFHGIAKGLLEALDRLKRPFQPFDEDFTEGTALSVEGGRLFIARDTCFVIEWEDGLVQDFPLRELQSHCPCALCAGEPGVEASVKGRRLRSVGRYALQLVFTSGCSQGIYSYSLLKRIGRVRHASTAAL